MNDSSVIGDACFAHRIMGSPRGKKLQVAAKKCIGWSCFSVKKSVFGHRMLLKSKKQLDEILSLPETKITRYNLRNKSSAMSAIHTDRFKNTFFNRIVFKYNVAL